MKATIQTHHQVKRFVRKIIDKFPVTDEIILLTDIHIQVNKETGELLAFDDNDSEITRCIIEQWINNNSKDFYSHAIYTLQIALKEMNQHIEQCGIP